MGASVTSKGDPDPPTGRLEDPVVCAQAFLTAIVWGEHTTIWELLSAAGRQAALAVAVRNGLDRVAASRIGDDVADPAEREDFLRQLVDGLRHDLRSVEAARVRASAVEPQSGAGDSDSVAVELVTPSDIPGTGDWPAGRLFLGRDPDRGWMVDRLEPWLAGS